MHDEGTMKKYSNFLVEVVDYFEVPATFLNAKLVRVSQRLLPHLNCYFMIF